MERYVIISVNLIHYMHCIILIFIFFSSALKAVGIEDDYIRGAVITDPSTTRRCEDLIRERNEKINYKNRLLSLIDKNKKLKTLTPQQKISIHETLDKTKKSLDDKLEKTSRKIQTSGEEIIRVGCPGITL